MENNIMYFAIVAGLLVLAYGMFGMPQRQPDLGFSAGASAAYAQGPLGGASSGAPGAKLSGTPPAECGDITSVKNLQHLSHHPDQFQECYKYVDPQKFKQATGRDLSEFITGAGAVDDMSSHHR